jgi:hypothetical protein
MTDRILFPDGWLVHRNGATLGYNTSKLGDRFPLKTITIGPLTHVYALPTPSDLGAPDGVLKALLVRAFALITGPAFATTIYNRAAWIDPALPAPGGAVRSNLGGAGKLRVEYVFEVEIGTGTVLTVGWNPSVGKALGNAEVYGYRTTGP